MPVVNTPVAHNARRLTIARPPGRPEEPEAVRSRELGPNTLLLSVRGEIDAATGPRLFDTITTRLRGHRQLVLDLSGIDFFGAAGYSVLHRLNVWCARSGVDWVVVTGAEVQRLLRVCDPEDLFPMAANIVAAVAALARGRQHLNLG